MDLHQIHTEDMFGPSLGRIWRSKVKVTRDKNGIFRPFRRPACGLCLVKRLLPVVLITFRLWRKRSTRIFCYSSLMAIFLDETGLASWWLTLRIVWCKIFVWLDVLSDVNKDLFGVPRLFFHQLIYDGDVGSSALSIFCYTLVMIPVGHIVRTSAVCIIHDVIKSLTWIVL